MSCARDLSPTASKPSRRSPSKAARRSSTPAAQAFHYIECLNESAPFIDALASLAEQHLGGWPTRRLTEAQAAGQARMLALRKQRALDLGASS